MAWSLTDYITILLDNVVKRAVFGVCSRDEDARLIYVKLGVHSLWGWYFLKHML